MLGKYLEEKAKGKTSSAIQKLIGLKPKTVLVIRNGEQQTIPLNEVNKGDLLLIKPGDKIPVDGKVKKGTTFINESMITGEPMPIKKEKNSQVFAGTINQNGAIKIIAKKVGSETLLSQIINLVEQAQATKPNIQKVADRVAGIFVPIVVIISLIAFGAWYFFGPSPSITYAILSLVTVLIIACPCALGLATPTALMVGIGKGAINGILIKDSQVLEKAHKINTIILDKTGTITEGKPLVTDAYWENEPNKEQNEKILLAIESNSEHPIAHAIVDTLKIKYNDKLSLDSFENNVGKGVLGTYKGEVFYVGNESLFISKKSIISSQIQLKINSYKEQAMTIVLFGDERAVLGILAISDNIKKTSKKAIDKIQSMGIDVIMLTGDNLESAKAIGNKVGIKTIHTNVLPTEKGGFVHDLQRDGKIVGMVGDGINDSHALAQADVGFAMGTGTDIAMESAEVTLMNSELLLVAKAIELSRDTMRTIHQNLFWAFVYNIVAIPIAAGAIYPFNEFLLSPMLAGAAMSLSSISVLLNSLRLKYK